MSNVSKFEKAINILTLNPVESDALSDDLLDAEIPCGGILTQRIARSCSRPAVLRSVGHGCPPDPKGPPYFKCLECWQLWYVTLTRSLVTRDYLRCRHCQRRFYSIDSFATYRPF
jgi:DNA-directed RNA polymerase subunit RPC12/RpoP